MWLTAWHIIMQTVTIIKINFSCLKFFLIKCIDYFTGIPSTGAAVLDSQGYEAILTVEASDEPHGVLNFASSSRIVLVQEGNKTIQLFINREYGSLGLCNSLQYGGLIFYECVFIGQVKVRRSHISQMFISVYTFLTFEILFE